LFEQSIPIAKIGKTVGINGALKLHLQTDFPEQFKIGRIFKTKRGDIKISSYNKQRSLISFDGYDSPQVSQKLINTILYSSIEETRKYCQLEDDTFFWFDLVNLDIVENEQILGKVISIERMGEQDYLLVKSSENLSDKNVSKEFLIPYIDRYVIDVSLEKKLIFTKDAIDLFYAS